MSEAKENPGDPGPGRWILPPVPYSDLADVITRYEELYAMEERSGVECPDRNTLWNRVEYERAYAAVPHGVDVVDHILNAHNVVKRGHLVEEFCLSPGGHEWMWESITRPGRVVIHPAVCIVGSNMPIDENMPSNQMGALLALFMDEVEANAPQFDGEPLEDIERGGTFS